MSQAGSAAAGAVVGQAAAVAAEQQRCDDIVGAVARQEPRLRWAAGTRADGSTLVATDLAGGWIPPGIGIPDGVTLPDPGSFTPGKTLQGLLGDTEVASHYAPGEQLGHNPLGHNPMDLSDSPRRVQPVPTLVGDLREAAAMRNHLPVVAHRIAQGNSLWASQTEIDELHAALAAQRGKVLGSYEAGATDMHAAANWMLLSAIAAVHSGGPGLAMANYHFRWFDAVAAERV